MDKIGAMVPIKGTGLIFETKFLDYKRECYVEPPYSLESLD